MTTLINNQPPVIIQDDEDDIQVFTRNGAIGADFGYGAIINDFGVSTTTVWSSEKTSETIASSISASGTASAYLHTQVSESAIWVVPHNLGHYPDVAVTDSTNHLAFAEVLHLSVNTLQVLFTVPQTGLARCI